jgi:Tfp pilus assembly protein PilO
MFFWKQQQVVILIVAGLVGASFVFFVGRPLRRKLKVVNQARAMQKLVMVKGTNEQRQLPLLKAQLLKVAGTVGDYEARVPANPDLGDFLQQIANLMSQQKLTEQVVAPGQEIKGQGLSCIPVNVQCKGKLAEIFGFYEQLQRLDRLVRIERVNLTNDGDFSGHVSMQTRAIVYYRSGVEPG